MKKGAFYVRSWSSNKIITVNEALHTALEISWKEHKCATGLLPPAYVTKAMAKVLEMEGMVF